MNRRGSASLLVAVGVVPVLLTAGIWAIDSTRDGIAQARLQQAIDAAAIAVARDPDKANRDKTAKAILEGYYYGGGGHGTLIIPEKPTSEPIPGQVQVQASVQVKSLLSGIAISGFIGGSRDPKVIAARGTAQSSGIGIELALVFDVTGSMLVSDGTTLPDGTRPTRIVAARDAALKLTERLYSGSTTTKIDGQDVTTKENLYISVVPYNIAVNIGTEYTKWLSPVGTPTYSHGHTWAGCVEARRGGYDLRDESPNTATRDTMFRRYFWPSTYNSRNTSSNGSCTTAQDYDSNRACQGNNDWTAPADLQRNNHLLKAWGSRASFGPNLMCPNVSVLPLTMSKQTVEAHINSLVGTASRPYSFSSGTAVSSGLQVGWYTLSPHWQGMWRNHDHRNTQRPALPLPYKAKDTVKVMVLLSDGDNNWSSARGTLTGSRAAGLVRPENRQTELYYNTYGNLSTNRLNISIPGVSTTSGGGDDDDDDGGDDDDDGPRVRTEAQLASDYRVVRPRADAALDTATLRTCAKIKESGVIVYVVGLGVAADSHRRLMENCASTPSAEDLQKGITSYYIHTENLGGLSEAFTHIANRLTNLRLTD